MPDLANGLAWADGLTYVAVAQSGLRILDFGPEYALEFDVPEPGSALGRLATLLALGLVLRSRRTSSPRS